MSFRRSLGAVSGAVVIGALIATPAHAAAPAAPVQDFLAGQLGTLSAATPTTVLVHGTDIAAARAAVDASGMRAGHRVRADRRRRRLGHGRPGPDGADAARRDLPRGQQPDQLLRRDVEHRHPRRRGGRHPDRRERAGAGRQWRRRSRSSTPASTRPTPTSQDADGSSAVVANLKSVCLDESTQSTDCVVPVPGSLDTDTISGGGHGTHVNGIVAGRPTTLSDGDAAPGRRSRRRAWCPSRPAPCC